MESPILAARLTLHEIKTRILHHHGHSYDFDPASFLSGDKPMKFKCQKHGPFFKKPEDFCPPICSGRIPKGWPILSRLGSDVAGVSKASKKLSWRLGSAKLVASGHLA